MTDKNRTEWTITKRGETNKKKRKNWFVFIYLIWRFRHGIIIKKNNKLWFRCAHLHLRVGFVIIKSFNKTVFILKFLFALKTENTREEITANQQWNDKETKNNKNIYKVCTTNTRAHTHSHLRRHNTSLWISSCISWPIEWFFFEALDANYRSIAYTKPSNKSFLT